MTMSIQTNALASSQSSKIQETPASLAQASAAQLSQGVKIDSDSDGDTNETSGIDHDHSSLSMSAQQSGAISASQAMQNGMSALQTANGGLDEMQTFLKNMASLVAQAGSGMVNGQALQALTKEYDALGSKLDTSAKSTSFNGQNLLNGSTSTLNVPTSNGQSVSVDMGNFTSSALGLSNLSGPTDSNAMQTIQGAMSAISSQQSQIGSAMQAVSQQVQGSFSNPTSASAATSLIAQQIMQNPRLAYQAQANSTSNQVMALLG